MPELTPPRALPPDEALVLLGAGLLSVEGQVTVASNTTLYCRVELDGLAAGCVYKPISGERPLWDYPDGTLAEREYASYLVGTATGWNLVPPTVLRDGPFGTGMVQLWIEEDDTFDLVGAINAGQTNTLQRMALFDAVVNNSDRKVGHLLPVPSSRAAATGSAQAAGEPHVYGIDHGVSFSVETKLRTVLWQWAGDPIPDEGLEMLLELDEQLRGELGEQLGELLTTREVRAATRRVARLIRNGCFPLPSTDWPSVPYPPY
ncbi:MAG: phosphatidylinositol 3-and 4-kinase [Frankiales bacterium]|nr:phosphatidylinositol 3-and 4-kinase [Frankiales bacterium]